MSLTYGFYNSVNGDRKYNALQMSSIFDGIIKDGVFMTIGDAMAVKATNGMGITIGVGRAWFNHTWSFNDALFPMTLDTSDVLLKRIDAVVLEINNNTAVRKNEFKIVKGTPSSSPQKPTLIKSELVNQYPLAYISVGAGVTSISQANITNAVGTSECPYVTGPLQGMNIDNLVLQWESQFTEWMNDGTDLFNSFYNNATSEYNTFYNESTSEFNNWFDDMKDQLSTDAAGNLQNQIDSIDSSLADKAPQFHAAEMPTYGQGTNFLYGHVRLEASIESNLDDTSGTAATPSAVKAAYDRAGVGVANAATAADAARAAQSTANAAMPKSGGTFTGAIIAQSANRNGAYIRNTRVQDASSNSQNTNFIIMVRK